MLVSEWYDEISIRQGDGARCNGTLKSPGHTLPMIATVVRHVMHIPYVPEFVRQHAFKCYPECTLTPDLVDAQANDVADLAAQQACTSVLVG